MGLKIHVLSGPLKGQDFILRDGFKLGRTQGDLILNDHLVSASHATVRANEDGSLTLVDHGSKNGLKFKDQKVLQLDLQPGVQFMVGQTELEIRPDPDPSLAPMTLSPSGDQPAQEQKKRKKWHEILQQSWSQLEGEIFNHPQSVLPLSPALRLTFISGLQAETQWTLGYGPRKIGSGSVDLPIYEPNSPQNCFELIPTPPTGITFRTDHPQFVLINHQSLASKLLENGDVVSLGQTKIEVEFLK